MATIDEYGKFIDSIIDALEQTRGKEAELTGKDLVALVRDRVQNDKVNAEGVPFGQYSEAVVPYWYYKDKESNVSDAAQKLLDSVGYFASYADFREVNNLQAGDIDLTFTGKMWKAATVQVDDISEGTATAVLTFGDEESLLKAGYHSDRFGSILQPITEEINAAYESYIERRIDFIGALFGG